MRLAASLTLSVLALSLGVFTPAANAETVVSQTYSGAFPASIAGTLPNEGTVLEEGFTLASAGTLTAFTTSYATGGFQPNLTLYDSTGTTKTTQWATPPPGASADPTTGLKADGYLMASNLAAGTYTLTLTDWALQQDPNATNLSDGFKVNYGNGTTFADVPGNTRTGNYALTVDFSPSSSTATPEPATFLFLAPALAIGWLLRKRIVPVR